MKINSSKIKTIAKHEILSTIKRKQFIIGTVGVPLVMIIIAIIGLYFSSDIGNLKIGYIDYFGVNIPDKIVKYNSIQQKNITLYFIEYHNIEEGKNDVLNGTIDILAIIPKDYLDTGKIIIYSTTKSINPTIAETLRDLLLETLLKDKVDNKTYNRVKSPLNLEIYSISEKGEEKESIFSQILPIGFVMILYIAITTVSGLIVGNTIEEKEHRIMEVLLSFTNAENIMIGKILGISVVGLIQISIWLMFALPVVIVYAIKVSTFLVAMAVVFFILAYLFYTSLLCGVASLYTNLKDASQIIAPIVIIQTIPFMMLNLILTNPNHYVVKILSYLPFTAPQVMLMRLSITNVEIWELVLSLAIMVLSTIASFIISIKLFKIGTLIYEENMSLKKVLKILRGNRS
ncbi:ABC transporter permease [Methanotorris igneus]|uniref:ABC-2 type transporter transmembrane domain-containing protein n=1 Tax=Methanotorris igneus (strain DSM 5666 / JCM 11834 / Kol 5) TaxID=880724 RepID=F6BEW4_METIK|nr:ABC transporter permease [Methanotorris igneus]AEF95700.1 hypothetical protein Metig_0140 [Methanotorris igneus Kol 5]